MPIDLAGCAVLVPTSLAREDQSFFMNLARVATCREAESVVRHLGQSCSGGEVLILCPRLRRCEAIDLFPLQDEGALGTGDLVPGLAVDFYLEMVAEALTADVMLVVVRRELERGWESAEQFQLIADHASALFVHTFNRSHGCVVVQSASVPVSD